MSDFSCAKIIRDTRQKSYYLAISTAELQYVSKSTLLNTTEKLIWINIAAKSALDPNLACLLTQAQIAEMVGKSSDAVYRAIKSLKFHGFLHTHYQNGDQATVYSLALPEEGVSFLISAPARNQGAPCKFADTPPAKTPTLLINNNINNKKHNHDAHSDFSPTENPDVLDADALICDFKNLIQEKYTHLPVFKRPAAALSHFTEAQKRAISERQLELTAITDGQKIQAERAQAQRFAEKLVKAVSVPKSRPQPADCKLVEFEFENEHFLIEEKVKNQILSQIPQLHSQKKILGEAAHKPIKALMMEILIYVAKAGSKTLDACQLKRFHTARKLCQKGAWERPNGLERQASIIREQNWQQAKIQENKFAQQWMTSLEQRVA